jgi:hypothetical protein
VTMDELTARTRALELAITARLPHEPSGATLTRADQYFRFLSGTHDDGGADLVQQVQSDAGPDLSKSDQTPPRAKFGFDGYGQVYELPTDDVKTRLVRAPHQDQFTEAK